jgi:hypothetical protein
MEKRLQRCSGVPGLCPVEAWVNVIERLWVVDFDPSSDHIPCWGRTPVCAFREGCAPSPEVRAQDFVDLLRNTCILHEGANKYGIAPEELGTRSIRSGAATTMALSLQRGNSDRKIMMLGRWKSLPFLPYIRPQVLEWPGRMAKDMAKTRPFLDVGGMSDQRRPRMTRTALPSWPHMQEKNPTGRGMAFPPPLRQPHKTNCR